jgi:urea-proton symporter
VGLLTATIAGQEFWQVAWALKKKDVSRTFLWAGAWFYPIPICLGLLGLIGLALHVDVNSQLGGDAAAVGPFLVSHLGLPTWLVILYVIVILSACYSVIDSAFTATSSVFVVDIITPLARTSPSARSTPGLRRRCSSLRRLRRPSSSPASISSQSC